MALAVPLALFDLITAIPVDCFQAGQYLYGNPYAGTSKDDFQILGTLSWDHVLTKIITCNRDYGLTGSAQVFYGVWKDGKVTDEIGLNMFGANNDDC